MTEAALALARTLDALNSRWEPHDAQRLVLNALFLHCFPIVFNESGRKGGKTEVMSYFLWRSAMMRPGGYYYFAPEQKQAKEIIWASERIQRFGPPDMIASINQTEMRITLTNGSFIKVDGSDNFNSYRGTEPHGVVYDEFRDFRPEFHRAMGANLAVHGAQLLICTTPPEALELDHYDGMKHGLELNREYFNFPSWTNPYISKDWLRKEKAKLYARGEGDVWEREYGAKRVKGGANSIFPMFSRARHVRPHADVLAEVLRDRKKLIWQVIADPGTSTRFAVLFRAINPYTKTVYRLGEIYEGDQLETSTSRMIPKIRAMKAALCPGWEALGIEWEQLYDEAAAWFAAEAQASFDDDWTPTQKALKDKSQGVSLLKDQMLHGLTVISDACKDLVREIEGYIRDKDGKIPKGNDHLIDCDRYGNDFASCDLSIEAEPAAADPEDLPRFRTPEQDMDDLRGADDYDLDDF